MVKRRGRKRPAPEPAPQDENRTEIAVPVPVPPAEVEDSAKPPPSCWADLSSGLDDVFNGRSMTRTRFMEIYSAVHNCCTAVNSETRTSKKNARAANCQAHYVCLELYERLKKWLVKHMATIQEVRET